MEQKLTAAIAGAYIGVEVKFTDIDNIVKVAKMDGIVRNTVHLGIPCNLISVPIQHKFISVGDCQLILTPLSKISDEDAVEVAKIASEWDRATPLGAEDVPEWLSEIMDGNCATYADYVNGKQMQQIIDYLRSKGYDCGHGNINSLISAGIAVEK